MSVVALSVLVVVYCTVVEIEEGGLWLLVVVSSGAATLIKVMASLVVVVAPERILEDILSCTSWISLRVDRACSVRVATVALDVTRRWTKFMQYNSGWLLGRSVGFNAFVVWLARHVCSMVGS